MEPPMVRRLKLATALEMNLPGKTNVSCQETESTPGITVSAVGNLESRGNGGKK